MMYNETDILFPFHFNFITDPAKRDPQTILAQTIGADGISVNLCRPPLLESRPRHRHPVRGAIRTTRRYKYKLCRIRDDATAGTLFQRIRRMNVSRKERWDSCVFFRYTGLSQFLRFDMGRFHELNIPGPLSKACLSIYTPCLFRSI